jgi:RimJ/RimL family protein N-acetyltransferase
VGAVDATRRLIIRSWRDDDAIALAAMGDDPEFVRYLQGRRWTIDDATDMIRHCQAVDDEIGVTLWALEDRGSSDLVGYCGLAPTNAPCVRTGLMEIGWGIERSRWGGADHPVRAGSAHSLEPTVRREPGEVSLLHSSGLRWSS